MEKKETTPRRAARRSYEERNKDKRKQTSGNFGTMIPRELYDEINAFLKERNMTKVDFIRTAYEIMKSEPVISGINKEILCDRRDRAFLSVKSTAGKIITAPLRRVVGKNKVKMDCRQKSRAAQPI